jgi:perosamine synthetase
LVLVPTLTFAATAEVVRYFDAVPVLCDVDGGTLCMTVETVREAVVKGEAGLKVKGERLKVKGERLKVKGERLKVKGEGLRVKAVIPVHYGGQPCDVAGITEVASEFGAVVIEDAAHSFPAGWRNADGSVRMVGNDTSRVACFSFYANKTITTGEGGMAVTADAELAARMRLMSLHGMNRDAWKRFAADGSWDYQIVAPGFKYNMTDIAAALGLSQLARAEEFRAKRAAVVSRYDEAFRDIEEIELLHREADIIHSEHLYVIKLRLDQLAIDRAEFIDRMKAKGVMCSVHWRPLHMHPYYVETYGYRPEDYPVAAGVWERIVSLPLFPGMREEEVEYVIDSVREVVKGSKGQKVKGSKGQRVKR